MWRNLIKIHEDPRLKNLFLEFLFMFHRCQHHCLPQNAKQKYKLIKTEAVKLFRTQLQIEKKKKHHNKFRKLYLWHQFTPIIGFIYSKWKNKIKKETNRKSWLFLYVLLLCLHICTHSLKHRNWHKYMQMVEHTHIHWCAFQPTESIFFC